MPVGCDSVIDQVRQLLVVCTKSWRALAHCMALIIGFFKQAEGLSFNGKFDILLEKRLDPDPDI
jgi:hypothetical protein